MSTDDRFFQITDPCPLALSELRGDGPTRYCEQCARQVHDLSALTRRQAVRLRLRFRRRGERLCGILRTVDGVPQFQPSLRERLRAQIRAMPALAMLISPGGCPDDTPPPAPPAIEEEEAPAEPTPDAVDEELMMQMLAIGGYID